MVFAITIDLFGLIPAIFITGVIAALGDTRTRLHEAAAIGAIMALGIWVVFVLLLNLPIDALRLG
ncbi:hypothetical protein [Pelagibacterium lacus]|uniref:hypothetical protein n=1 Tax=Pelagibacterium lacus TaxID=2282655 RepID=UPI001FE968C2|nr:hypothetical protein [Pelagibacterium lacus]